MNKLFILPILLVASYIAYAAQSGTEIRRGGGGISSIGTNAPGTIGQYLTTDGTNYYWAIVSATSTNPLPAYALTNNDTRNINIIGGISNQGNARITGFLVASNGATILNSIQLGDGSSGNTIHSNVNTFYYNAAMNAELILGAANGATANRVLYLTAGRQVDSTDIDATEMSYLDNVTSSIQDQFLGTSNRVVVVAGTGGITVTPSGSGGVMTFTVNDDDAGGGSGGTNFPPVLNLLGVTNLTATSGVELSWTLTTNGSFGINFDGTPPNGKIINLSISNNAASTIYMTNYVGSSVTGIHDYRVGSNVTQFAIAALSVSHFQFRAQTNFNNGANRYELTKVSGLEYELATGGYLRFTTNANTVTLYNAITVDYIDAGAFRTNATNWSATYNYTNQYQGAAPQIFYTFNDTATNEIWFVVTAPQNWDLNPIKAKFHWTSTNTIASKTNTWTIAANRASGTDFDDATMGTEVIIRSAHSAGKEYNISPATGNITVGGSVSAGDLIRFRGRRDPNDANDNMVGQNRLHAIELQWGLTNAVVAAWQ